MQKICFVNSALPFRAKIRCHHQEKTLELFFLFCFSHFLNYYKNLRRKLHISPVPLHAKGTTEIPFLFASGTWQYVKGGCVQPIIGFIPVNEVNECLHSYVYKRKYISSFIIPNVSQESFHRVWILYIFLFKKLGFLFSRYFTGSQRKPLQVEG